MNHINISLTTFINEHQGMLLGYHVTSKRNLRSIMKKGLLPHVPEDYGERGDVEGVYLFKSLDDTRNALYNWFGERIEEIEEETGRPYNEVCLEVDITGLDLYDSVEYEWTCLEVIPPERILRVIDPI